MILIIKMICAISSAAVLTEISLHFFMTQTLKSGLDKKYGNGELLSKKEASLVRNFELRLYFAMFLMLISMVLDYFDSSWELAEPR
jgi:hypothetical protein